MSQSPPLPAGTALRRMPAPLAGRALVRRAGPDLLVLLGIALLIVLGTPLSYLGRIRYGPPIESESGLAFGGLGAAEWSGEAWHRWAAPSSRLRIPGTGAALYQVELQVHNPVADAPRTLAIAAGDRRLAVLPLRPGWQRLRFEVPPDVDRPGNGDFDLLLQTTPSFRAGNRELGIAVRELRLEQRTPAVAPWTVRWSLLIGAGLLLLLLRLLGTPLRWSGPGAAVLVVGLLLLLAVARIHVLLAWPVLLQSLVLSLLGLPLLAGWLRAQPSGARPWARAVALVAIGSFAVLFAGMRHPQFVQIDHTLRVHQIEAIAGGQRAVVQAELSRQYEWGRDVLVPYSLLSYDLFVPLVRCFNTPRLIQIVEAVTAALHAGIPVLLWSIARRSGWDARASWWAAALFATMPVGYLYFHDGSYPTIIALCMVVAAVWLTVGFVRRPSWWRWVLVAAAVALGILLYVTHLAFVPALLGAALASALVLGSRHLRRSALLLALAAAAGLLLALFGYYGSHLPELVTRTIPRYLLALNAVGSVGRDPTLLPGALLGNAWQQLWGHYRVVGVVLAAVGVALALRQRERWLAHVVVGYGLMLLLTAIADTRFGLWNKHMYFALPGVCLAAGPVLAALQGRGRAGMLLAWGVFAYMLWTSLDAWLQRVIWYVWSLQTI